MSNLLDAMGELETEIPDAPSTAKQLGQQADNKDFEEDSTVSNMAKGALLGVGNAIIESKDFVFGEPEEEEKSQLRKIVEFSDEKLQRGGGVVANITSDITQFATGMVGLGKIKLAKNAGRGAKAALEIGKAATVGAVAFDPHEERLSNLVESNPSLQNPVTEYLAANPNDSAAEGRFKAAIESIGMDITLGGIFLLSLKATKALRLGDKKAARKFFKAIEKAKATEIEAKSAANNPKGSLSKLAPDGGTVPRDVIDVASPVGAQAPLKVEGSVAQGIPAKQAKGRSKKPIEVSEEDVVGILSKTSEDLDAIAKHGTRYEAGAQGYQFDKQSLPWKKLRAPEDVELFMENAAAALKSKMDVKKGGAVLTDAAVANKVGAYARLYGEEPALIMGELAGAGEQASQMVAKMEASYLVANKMFQDTAQLASNIKNGLLGDFGGDLALANEELIARLGAATDMMASAKSVSANSGRALRRMRKVNQLTDEQLAGLKSLDGEELVDAIMKADGDPKKMAEAATPGFIQKVIDGAQYSLTNSLLWMYPTHVVNTVTNGYMLFARPTEKLIGGIAKRDSAITKRAAKEYLYTMTAISDAWDEAVDAFTRGDSKLSPHSDDFFEQGGGNLKSNPIEWSQMKSVNGLLENLRKASFYTTVGKNAVGLPTRALGAMDEFFKTMRYRAVVQADASFDAIQAGMKGNDYKNFIQTRMDEAFDANGRGINAEALQEAQITTFQQELLSGTAGNAVRNARTNWQPLGFVLPFVKTPVNVIRYSWKMTPGLNLLQTEYRKMLTGSMGETQQAQAIGQMVLGSLGAAMAANMVNSGSITGGGPQNQRVRSELTKSGWVPYSYKFVDSDGKTNYFPLGRFDPVGMVFGMVADIVEAQKADPNGADTEKGALAIAVALAKNFSEKSFLLNFNQAIRAMTDPDKHLSKYLGGMAGNVIPGSSAIRGYVNQDPYLRDARGFIDNMLKNMPAYSETLPPSRTALGEPVMKQVGLIKVDQTDEVEAELNRIMLETGSGITPPAPTRDGLDLRDIELSNGQPAYDRFQELAAEPKKGRTIKAALLKIIKKEQYLLLPDGDASTRGTKLYALSGVVSKFRQTAFKVLLKENPELREALGQKQLDVRSKLRANKAQNKKTNDLDAIKDILNIK